MAAPPLPVISTDNLTWAVPTALRIAMALVPLKVETPGRFLGSRWDAEADLRELH